MWSESDTTMSYGGGFLDSSQAPDAGDVGKKSKRAQTIVPVLVKNLTSAPSVDELTLWNIPARITTFVGVIRHIDESTTKISYEVEDETGTITALKWLEADKKTPEPIMEINTYARIYGLLREQNEKRHVLILRIWPLTNLNELTNHLLEVTYAMLKAESLVNNPIEVVRKTEAEKEEEAPFYGMSADQTLVYKIIHAENHTESGIERSEIKSRVPKRILPNIDKILDFLVSEGHIYTTSTDDHFKST